ncbi:MAG: thiamine phosphate synthase [Clostridiales bacterium]|jgi:thiamine-phosphate pyrophosphorylase|nr:thiamine phosphate synthase [Clostridiales bacterium]
MTKTFDPTLYLITDHANLTLDQMLSKVDSALKGGVTLVQSREKDCTTLEYITIANRLHQITQKYNVPLIIDDRIDVAQIIGAEGVHLGTDDAPIADARRVLGEHAIIGATAKSIERAKQAQAEGADYLGTGAIFAPTVKVKTHHTSIEMLGKIASSVDIPTVAISGINRSNLSQLSGSPIAGIALIAAIMDSQEPENEARLLLSDIKSKIIANSPYFNQH